MAEGREIEIGIVEIAAPSTSGIKLEGQEKFWNVLGKAREYVKPDLKGKEVEMEIKDKEKRTVDFIRITNKVSKGPNAEQQRTYNENKARDIKLQNAGKVAGSNFSGQGKSAKEIADWAKEFKKELYMEDKKE